MQTKATRMFKNLTVTTLKEIYAKWCPREEPPSQKAAIGAASRRAGCGCDCSGWVWVWVVGWGGKEAVAAENSVLRVGARDARRRRPFVHMVAYFQPSVRSSPPPWRTIQPM
eukprot:scaffold83131_cov42-Phaeocystis_antarctica.AAC.1